MTHIDPKIQRSNCFKLLSACFYEPDKEFFLQEKLCENLANLLNTCGYSDAATAGRNMQKALMEIDGKELTIEHARLFLGPFELLAPPYGSVYLEERRMLMGESTMEVKKIYQEAGLSLEIMEAPDHIAFELEFMHYLCCHELEAEANDNNDEVNKFATIQSDFMRRFVAPWIADFCDNIRKGTDNAFYKHLADCLECFIAKESSLHEMTGMLTLDEGSHACQASA